MSPEDLLATGEMEILGLLPYASNVTLLATLKDDGAEALAVYKPRRGERPLWDFPDGTLCLRERATYVVDAKLGWNLVPRTVVRDGPAGFGAVQLYVEEDDSFDVRDVIQSHPDDVRRMALLDVVINNADRKAGHLICDTAGKLWGVDHGVCFHEETKLRTVIWAFEGEDVPPELLGDLEAFAREASWRFDLEPLLSPDEIDALCSRIAHVIRTERFPSPPPGRYHVPWPPW